MQLNVTCPTCGASGVLPDAKPGEAIACPQCNSVFVPPQSRPGMVQSPALADVLGVWLGPATATDLTTTAAPPAPPPARSPAPARPPAPPVAPSRQLAPAVPTGQPSQAVRSEWAQGEVARINQYMGQQFDKLKQARHLLVEMETKAEAAIQAREAELNRREAEQATRRTELDRREAEFAASAEALGRREAETARTASILADRETAVRELEARRQRLEKEVADLSRLASELRPMVERLQVRRDEDAAARAELAASQSALDRRMVEVGRTELTLQTRLDELDQLESELRSELEARERELERQRATLAEELRALRRPSIDAPTPPPASWSVLDRGGYRAGPTQSDIQLSPPNDSQTS